MSIFSTGHAVQLIARLLDPKTATEPLVEFGPQKPPVPLGRSVSPLPEDVPERQGVSSRHIAAFLRQLREDPTLHMHSVLIVRHGKILCRAAFGAQQTDLPKLTFSACKSITALAVGLAMDDGLLRPDDCLSELFADVCGPVSRRLWKDVTVAHLLSMTAPVYFNEASSMTTDDWVRGYLSAASMAHPGRKFQYNSLNSYMLAAIVTRLTGRSLTDYLTERLFAPMGIGDFYWETCPRGIEKGGWGLYMLPEDLAKLGILVQNGGVWNGRQLISRAFLEQALQTHAITPDSLGDFNYGWQIWVGRQEESFLFNGMLGQNVLCYRDNDVILVSHAGNSESFQQSNFFKHAADWFSSPLPDTLPRDAAGEKLLRQTLAELSDTRGPLPSAEAFAPFNGHRFEADDSCAVSAGLLPLVLQAVNNSYSRGLQAITVTGSRRYIQVLYEERDQLHTVLAGTQEPVQQELTFHGSSYRVAAQAKLTTDEDDHPVLRLQLDFLETPCSRILKLVLKPGGPVLKQEETPGGELVWSLASDSLQAPAARALAGAVLGNADPDFFRWRLERVFSPALRMKQVL